MLQQFQSHGVRFIGGIQFWSNPLLADFDKVIAIMKLGR